MLVLSRVRDYVEAWYLYQKKQTNTKHILSIDPLPYFSPPPTCLQAIIATTPSTLPAPAPPTAAL